MSIVEEICTRRNSRVLKLYKQYLQHNMDAQQQLVDLCAVYKKVRPALSFAKALLFWKPKWAAWVKELMDKLDEVCPG
jgi:uncharacterized protein VirK/YbjX